MASSTHPEDTIIQYSRKLTLCENHFPEEAWLILYRGALPQLESRLGLMIATQLPKFASLSNLDTSTFLGE